MMTKGDCYQYCCFFYVVIVVVVLFCFVFVKEIIASIYIALSNLRVIRLHYILCCVRRIIIFVENNITTTGLIHFERIVSPVQLVDRNVRDVFMILKKL